MLSILLEKMKDDLHKAMKLEVEMRKDGTNSGTMYESTMAVKNVIRSIISMCPELGVKPDKASDENIIKLLKKYITMEKIRELYLQHHLSGSMVIGLSASKLNILQKNTITDLGTDLTSMKIAVAYTYLPEISNATTDDILEFIKDNINFDDYKNKMQAMGPIMKEFDGVDGNVVRRIIEGYTKHEKSD